MDSSFFKNNRDRIIRSTNGGLIVLSAYALLQRANDAAHSFEQESNFWYLTGVDHPDWWVIIDGQRDYSWLVAPDVEAVRHIFDGSLSFDEAKRISGVNAVISRDDGQKVLRELGKKHSIVYALGEDPNAGHYDFTLNPAPKKLWNMLARTFSEVQDCRLDISRLRAIKQPVEIAAIKKAIALTRKSFDAVKRQLPELKYEYEVEAEFTYRFRKSGALGHAYDPIVASAGNACTLHYCTNNARLKNNSLLLIDIGARVDGYPADITRTYAVGSPTSRQIQIHQAVEQAHGKIIALLRPGLNIAEYHKQVDVIMRSALDSLSLLKNDDDYRRYFPHAISHGLGVDVHDSLGRPDEFQSGMVLTVEPGIYIPDEGIGVRIEDDVLITDTGHTNLSKALSTSL